MKLSRHVIDKAYLELEQKFLKSYYGARLDKNQKKNIQALLKFYNESSLREKKRITDGLDTLNHFYNLKDKPSYQNKSQAEKSLSLLRINYCQNLSSSDKTLLSELITKSHQEKIPYFISGNAASNKKIIQFLMASFKEEPIIIDCALISNDLFWSYFNNIDFPEKQTLCEEIVSNKKKLSNNLIIFENIDQASPEVMQILINLSVKKSSPFEPLFGEYLDFSKDFIFYISNSSPPKSMTNVNVLRWKNPLTDSKNVSCISEIEIESIIKNPIFTRKLLEIQESILLEQDQAASYDKLSLFWKIFHLAIIQEEPLKKSCESFSKAKDLFETKFFGQQKLKNEVYRFLALKQFYNTSEGKILCLDGPPGTGKTAVCTIIAEILNRKFFKISAPGFFHPGQVKGWPKSYKMAKEGILAENILTCASNNPVVMIDEFDKICSNNDSNLSQVFLEILDPGQNSQVYDNFLEVPINLSNIFFIITVNEFEKLPLPLQNRCYRVSLNGYSLEDKLIILQNYLLPQSLQKLNPQILSKINFSEDELTTLVKESFIDSGTRSLIRSLENLIADKILSAENLF